jgi:hypothetical protein
LLKAFDCPNVRLEKTAHTLVYDVFRHKPTTIITEGRTSLLFQTFMRVVEVLSMEKAKRFLSYDCGGPSATVQI